MPAKHILCLGGEKSNAFANLHRRHAPTPSTCTTGNNGGYVFYDSKHFAPTVDHWNTVPVIYCFEDGSRGRPAEHPQFKDVITRTLPAKVPHGVGAYPPPI